MNEWRPVSHTESLDAAALSARRAREVVQGVCSEALVSEPMVETAMLLVSEIVTNAVTHGGGPPVLDIDVGPTVLRVSVNDDGEGAPEVRRPTHPLAGGGRGLRLIETLAERWGTNRHLPTGKTVWFELEHD